MIGYVFVIAIVVWGGSITWLALGKRRAPVMEERDMPTIRNVEHWRHLLDSYGSERLYQVAMDERNEQVVRSYAARLLRGNAILKLSREKQRETKDGVDKV